MLLGQTEPLPQDGFMFNFLVPKKKKVRERAPEAARPAACFMCVSAGNHVLIYFQMAAWFSWFYGEPRGISSPGV